MIIVIHVAATRGRAISFEDVHSAIGDLADTQGWLIGSMRVNEPLPKVLNTSPHKHDYITTIKSGGVWWDVCDICGYAPTDEELAAWAEVQG